jgi:DNA-binding CsgD family transcriptional regulator
MSIPVRASERDLRALAGIVTEDRPDLPPREGLPLSLLADLMGQIRCNGLLLQGFDSERQLNWGTQGLPAPADDATAEALDETDKAAWEHHWDCQFCSYADRTGDIRSVIKISDFYSARQWHSTGMRSDIYRPLGLEHQLQLCLPAAPRTAAGTRRTIRLALYREPGPDFSERDRALLTLLRPHLHQAYLDAERRRRGTPRLTPRQWELLRLVAAGHTNAQIARRLGLSEGTVRKHLENIYTRLNVSSRTAAVTRAFPNPAVI